MKNKSKSILSITTVFILLLITLSTVNTAQAISYSVFRIDLKDIYCDETHDFWGNGEFYVKVRIANDGDWTSSDEHSLAADSHWTGTEYLTTESFLQEYEKWIYVELWEADPGNDELIAEGELELNSSDDVVALEGSGGDCYGSVLVTVTHYD